MANWAGQRPGPELKTQLGNLKPTRTRTYVHTNCARMGSLTNLDFASYEKQWDYDIYQTNDAGDIGFSKICFGSVVNPMVLATCTLDML